MNSMVAGLTAHPRIRERIGLEADGADLASHVDGFVDVLLSVIVFRNPAMEGASFLLQHGTGSRKLAGATAEGLRTCYLFELACYLLFALDTWHSERGLGRLRDTVFRAIVLPRFFSVFDLPGSIANLEEIVVSRLESYRLLATKSPADVRTYFMQAVVDSAFGGGPRVETLSLDYAVIADNMVLAMAALSDLTAFAAGRLPLCVAALGSFYERLYSSTSR